MFLDASNPIKLVHYFNNNMKVTPCSECFVYYSSRCRLCRFHFDGIYCTYARCFKYNEDGIAPLLK